MLDVEGLIRCSRYAFGPNRLHYCGPDANRELLAYIKESAGDAGLEILLSKFNTLYPYLRLIAHQNGVRDPFDKRVVEAYWIGNALLEHVEKGALYRNFQEALQVKKKIGAAAFARLSEKIAKGALPHHSFHVLNVWRRTGHHDSAHTIESMDACRVSWGTVRRIQGPYLTVETQPLVYEGDKLNLGKPVLQRVTRDLAAEIDELCEGDYISMHWKVPCEVLSAREVAALKRYTLKSIHFANQGI